MDFRTYGLEHTGAYQHADLLKHGAYTITLLSYYCGHGVWHHFKPFYIIDTLFLTVPFLGHTTGFIPKKIYTRSLCAASVMDLFNARVDVGIVRHIIRWRPNAMLRYFHVQDAPVMIFFPPP